MFDNLDIVKQIRDLTKEISDALNKQPDAGSISNSDFWENLRTSIDKNNKSAGQFNASLKKTSTTLKFDFNKAAIVAKSSLEGLGQGFRNLHALVKSSTSVFGGFVGLAWNIGKAIAAIPFRMLDGLEKMAANGPQTQELAEAYERVRAEFGDLARGASKDIIDISNAMGKLDGTGVSVLRVWGNLAKRVEAVQKLVSGMGASFNIFQMDIVSNGEAIMRFNKALGVTDEQMASISSQSLRMGKSVSGIELEMAKQALGMSKAFGINAKVIGRDMARAMADLAHFGHLSSKEMAVTATFAQKLGVSVDKLTSIMDATSTFDQTAESMGKLNEQFGTNVDFAQIMMAQDPAEKVEILRKEFQRTGLSLDKMNYQQRMLLKQTTSFDDAMLNAAFSTKNMGVTLASVTAQGTKNEKTAMTQTEALTHLADSIERLTDPGPQASGGIFERMLHGMNAAIQSSPQFLGLMRSIVKVFKAAYMTGMDLGRMFVGMWPGVKDVLGGFTDFFTMADSEGNAKGWGKLFNGILTSFKSFSKDTSKSVIDLMKSLQTNFLDFFSDSEAPAKRVLEGVRKFLFKVSEIFSQFAILAIDEFSKFVPKLLDWLKNPHLPNMSSYGNSWVNILDPFKAVLDKAQEVLWPAIKKLAMGLYEMIGEALAKDNRGLKLLVGAIGVVLAPALTQGLATVLSTGLFKEVANQSKMGALTEVFFNKFFEKEKNAAPGSAVANAAEKNIKTKEPGTTAEKIASVVGMSPETVQSFTNSANAKLDWDQVAKNAAGLAAVMTIFTGAFWAVMKIIQDVNPASVIAGATVMGSFALLMSQMPKLASSLKDSQGADWKSLGMTMLGMAGFMTLGMAGFATALLIIKDIPVGDVIKAGIALTAMAGVMTAAAIVGTAAMAMGAILTLSEGAGAVALIAGLTAMGGIVVAAAGLTFLVTKTLGNMSASAMSKSIAAIAGMSSLLAASGALLLEASIVGAVAMTGIGAVAMVAGIASMSLLIHSMANLAVELSKRLGSLSSERFSKTAAIMTGMTALYAAMPSLIKSAAFAGVLSFLFPHETITKIVIEMADTGKKIIKTLGGVSPQAAAITGIAIAGMVKLYEQIPGLILSGAGIGLVMMTGIGLGAMVAGLAGINKVVMSMAETGQNLVTKFGEIPVDKIGRVTSAMLAVGGLFAVAGGVILEAAAVGVGLALGGAAPALLGWKAMDAAVSRMVDVSITIFSNITRLNLTEDPTKTSAAFVSIISAVSELFMASAKILGSMPSGIFDTFMSVEKKIGAAQKFMESLIGSPGSSTGITGLIATIKSAISGVPASDIEAAKGVASILGSIGTLLGAMIGPAMEMQKRTTAWHRMGETEAVLFGDAIGKVQEFMITVKDRIGDMLKQVSAAVKTLSSDITPEQMNAASSYLSSTFSAIGSLMTSLKPPDVKVDSGFLNYKQTIDIQIPSVADILNTLQDKLPSLFRTLRDITGEMPTSEDFLKQIEVTTKLFGVLNPVLESISKLSEAAKDNAGVAGDKETVLKVLSDLHGYLWSLRDPSKLGLVAVVTEMKGLADALTSVASVEDITNASNLMTTISSSLTNFSERMQDISNVFGNLNESIANISSMATDVQTQTLVRTMKTVSDIVSRTQELEDALSDIKLSNIPVKLEKIAKDGSLMGPYNYTVKSKDVTINMKVEVYMKASEVEKAIVHRSDSIIRDRINYALGGIDGANEQKPESIRSYPVESGLYAPDVN